MLEFIVDIEPERDDSALLRFAFALARQHAAHLTGLQVVMLSPAEVMVMPDAMLVLEEREQAAHGRRDWWRELCRGHGVEGSWEAHRGFHEAVLSRRASLADLVLGRLSRETARLASGLHPLGRVLSTEAAPMLLVPDRWPDGNGVRKVAIAWNGSTEAARAVRAAAPLLQRAEEIVVLDGVARIRANARRIPLALDRWLERHALQARWEILGEEDDNGQSIHDRARHLGTDLLVMGAWGHSRMNEWLLGGVTRHLLQHSEIPLLVVEE
jgi:nucleotide-binding universal stress UspA family protein